MWKVHTELRQSSTHPRPQKTCSLSGILGHTCNIQKSFKSYLMWQLITLKGKTNKRQTLPGDTEGIGTAGWGCPQKGSCAMLTLGWNWELKLQGLCVCGVGCGMWFTAVYTHNVTHLVCAFFLESGILLHTRQMVPMKLVTINTGTEVLLTDVDMHCCLHWGGGGSVLASLWSDLQNFPFALPAMSTVKCWVVGPPKEPENLVLRPSDI